MRRIILLLILMSLFQVAAATDYAGEKITYAISPLGSAEYNDMGMAVLDGKNVKLITFRTRTIGFKDIERIYYDPKLFLPLRVERNLAFFLGREYLVEEYTPADFSLNIKKYVNEKVVKEYHFKAEGPINNVIMLPFYLRSIGVIEPGQSFTVYLPDTYVISLISIDEITVPAGKFKAYHFTSQPHKFDVWISQDADRLPLKIKSTVGHGYTMVMKNRVFNKDKVKP
jgi:hypothetical protein